MWIKRHRAWEPPESSATPESAWRARRRIIKTFGVGAAVLGLDTGGARATLLGRLLKSGTQGNEESIVIPDVPWNDQLPAERNGAYQLDRALTPEAVNATFNNFYEFGSHKEIWEEAQALELSPWQIKIDGMVENKITIDVEELIRRMPLEERLYRLRCVEAWSMTIPWTGFPLAELIKFAKPLSGAKFLRMEAFMDKDVARGQTQPWNPWPYVEGLTLAEATNELAFIAVGTYGHTALKQHGAPLRLAVPWKYGFKSIKSIVRFTFSAERPVSFWEELQGTEYGFWANVNPGIPHPRWSQAREEIIHTGEKVPTKLYNGYAEQVGHLYKNINLPDEVLYR
ncbi:MAG: Protein-methionine-sulfoxide reductase catalytic subunit MsrP [Gammaproteobacteria bacterium]|nr:Protein-methionine-sulfoxide reductase catalytic subunit MsrP [Gammaproteobacteria bacterium]